MPDTYETHAKGIRIFPGAWRPHYPFEQIAWVSPPWPSQDYIWLDFPEAIFTNEGLRYLSHVNPTIHFKFPNLPKQPWQETDDGISFERELPDGVRFGGSVKKKNQQAISLELHIANGSPDPLRGITLQTCAYLRAIKEFSDFTLNNKFVHLPKYGWLSFPIAFGKSEEAGGYRLGWRSGKALADLPFMACTSNKDPRLVAMTWFEDTYSLIGNPDHPCMHADPYFPDLSPGADASIRGEIIFFDGALEEFDKYLSNHEKRVGS